MLERYYRFEAPLKAGVIELLEQLRESGVKLCIATATDRFLVMSPSHCYFTARSSPPSIQKILPDFIQLRQLLQVYVRQRADLIPFPA